LTDPQEMKSLLDASNYEKLIREEKN